MDPNQCLKEIRLLVSEMDTASDETAAINYGTLAERIKALDEWIMKGGFLPTDWELWSRPALIYEKQKGKAQ